MLVANTSVPARGQYSLIDLLPRDHVEVVQGPGDHEAHDGFAVRDGRAEARSITSSDVQEVHHHFAQYDDHEGAGTVETVLNVDG